MDIPQVDEAILHATGNVACWMKGHSHNHARVTLQDFKTASFAHIPHTHRFVVTTTGEHSAIGAKGYGPDEGGMAAQNFETVSCVYVPYPYRLIVSGGHEKRVIRAECKRSHPLFMARQCGEETFRWLLCFSIGGDAPQFHATIITTAGK